MRKKSQQLMMLLLLLVAGVSSAFASGKYVKITSTNDLSDGKYLIVYYDSYAHVFDGSLSSLDVASNYVNKSIAVTDNAIASSTDVDGSYFTISKSGSNYLIKSASGYYIGKTADSNGMDAKTTELTNTITFATDGTVNVKGSGGAYLRFNASNGQTRFRYFKSSTYTGQKAINLYKYIEDADPTKDDAALAFTPSTLTLDEGSTGNVAFTKSTTADVTFANDNPTVATYDETTGVVTALAAGTATITATSAENDEYNAGSASLTITVNKAKKTVVTVTPDEPYTEAFTDDEGNFVINNVTLPSAISSIWTAGNNNGNKFMKATSYSGSNYDGEGWLVSPTIDLTGVNSAALSFSQSVNKYFGTVADEAMLKVSDDDGATWTKMELTYPAISGTWSSFETQTVDLSNYAGKSIKVAFQYIGTSTTAGTWEINSFRVEGSMTKVQKDAVLSFPQASYTVTVDDEFTAPTASAADGFDGVIVYASSNENLAMVDEETGEVVIGSTPGTVTITATSEATENFKAGEASYTIVIKAKPIELVDVIEGNGKYELLTSTEDLKAGKRILFVGVNEETYYAMSNDKGNNRNGVETTLTSGLVVPTEDMETAILQGKTDQWVFQMEGGFLYAGSSTANQLKTKESIGDLDENGYAVVTLNNDGTASVVFQGDVDRNELRFNYNGGSPLFSCYGSTSKLPCAYIYIEQEKTTEVRFSENDDADAYEEKLYEYVGETVDATLTRTLGEYWNTFCVPFDATADQIEEALGEVTIKEFDESRDGVFYFKDATTFTAGMPYLVKPAAMVINPQFKNVTVGEAEEGEMVADNNGFAFVGVLYKTDLKADKTELFINTKGEFKYPADASKTTMKGLRAYFIVPEGTVASKLAIALDGVATSIDEVEGLDVPTTGHAYTLSGQQVSRPQQKGIYIVNGKKTVVK